MAAAASFFFLIFLFSSLFGCTSSQLQYTDLPWSMQVLFFSCSMQNFYLLHAEIFVISCRIQFPTRDRTQVPCIGSEESQPLDQAVSPQFPLPVDPGDDKSALLLCQQTPEILWFDARPLQLSECLNKVSHTHFLMSQCIQKLYSHYTVICQVCNSV